MDVVGGQIAQLFKLFDHRRDNQVDDTRDDCDDDDQGDDDAQGTRHMQAVLYLLHHGI